MAITTRQYFQLIQDTAASVTRSHANWTSFLRTVARLYPYRFPDQLAIHAQRPDATACTSYDKWNEQHHRYVKRGSKGIALLDDSQATPRLRYVFDVSDIASPQDILQPVLGVDEKKTTLPFVLHRLRTTVPNTGSPMTSKPHMEVR